LKSENRKLEIATLVSYMTFVDSGQDPLSQRKYCSVNIAVVSARSLSRAAIEIRWLPLP
jgi:hypothetical protein